MAKVFLQNKKWHRPFETMEEDHEENIHHMDSESDRSTDSPKESRPDPDSSLEFPRLTTRYPSPTNITLYPSAGSAFSHVDKRYILNADTHTATSLGSPEMVSGPSQHQTIPAFGYPVASSTPEEPQRQLPLFFAPPVPTASSSYEQTALDLSPKLENSPIPVDTNVPFSAYFENLTKVLQQSREKMGLNRVTMPQMSIDEADKFHQREERKEQFVNPLTTRLFQESAPRVPTITVPTLRQPISVSDFQSSAMTMTSTQTGLLPASLRPNMNYAINSTNFYQSPIIPVPGMGFRRHSNPNKPPALKKYKCDVCGKAFSRSNTLVTHKRIHTGDKPFKCELCGRAFRQPGNLTRHRLTHTTVKPYVCPQCNKAFNRASNLHTHMRTHTNFKPFVCPFCGKGFHQKIDMKIHCYTHTGERPHKCDICGKGFTLSSTLNTHRKTHGETKSHQCQRCGKSFYDKNDLKNHLLTAHSYAVSSSSTE